MTTSLDQLPFDVLFCVTLNLDLEDIFHLGQTCRQLRALLDERTVCRRAVEVSRFELLDMLTYHADAAYRSTTHTRKKHFQLEMRKIPTSKPFRLFMRGEMPCQLHTPIQLAS
jgi:hypothetical protein